MTTLTDHLQPDPKNKYFVRPMVELANGLQLSIQASEFHYCHPQNNIGPYTHVEVWATNNVGIPEEGRHLVMDVSGEDYGPAGYVPVTELQALIDACGGIKEIRQDS